MTIPRKRYLLIGAAVVLGLVAAGWAFVDVTARRAGFCANCHYMQPYVDQWKASTHKGVECVKCHPTQRRAMLAQALKYATGTYSPRPRAIVPDSACLSCHDDMAKSKAVTFKTITFPHQPHLATDRRGIHLHCASCHGSSREAGHVSVDERVCFLCHFKGQSAGGTIGACGACHGAPSGMTKHGGFQFDMKSYVDSGVQCSRCHLQVHEGEGEVSKDKCFSCHVSRLERMGDTSYIHWKHVGDKEVRCLDCHEPIRHGNIKVLSVLDVSCESCHQNLHAGAKEMYLGVGARGAESTPSRMFAAQISCSGCHTQVVVQGGVSFLGQGSKSADPKACAACHDSRYMPMVDRWKSQGKTLAAEARRMAGEGARDASRAQSPEARTLASDLEFNARFLEQGHPVHNIEYAIKTVQASARILGKLSGTKVQVQPPFARDAFSYCQESCHTFIPRKEPYDFRGVDFPHAYHVQKASLSCDTCHAENKHKEMVLGSPADCASCHHDSAKADCARCHGRQTALFQGKVPATLGMTAGPDSMAEAVGCVDCHDPTKPDALKEVSKACVGCHEAQGAKDLEAWRVQLKAREDRARLLADEAVMSLDNLRRRQADVAPLARRLQAVRDRLDYLSKAKGVHNVKAALAEYDRAAADLQLLLSDAAKLQSTAGRR